jgi:hypothetical protein
MGVKWRRGGHIQVTIYFYFTKKKKKKKNRLRHRMFKITIIRSLVF